MAAQKKELGKRRMTAEVSPEQVRFTEVITQPEGEGEPARLTGMLEVPLADWRKAGAPLAVEVTITALDGSA